MDNELISLVKIFYRERYWDRIKGDMIPEPRVAGKVFDISVNFGVRAAGIFLQTSLNVLNKGTMADLMTDGFIGPVTLSALNVALRSHGNGDTLLRVLIAVSASHYVQLAELHKDQRIFIRGWMYRAFHGAP